MTIFAVAKTTNYQRPVNAVSTKNCNKVHTVTKNLDIQSGTLETGDSYYSISTMDGPNGGRSVTKSIAAQNGEALSITCKSAVRAAAPVGPSLTPADFIRRLCDVAAKAAVSEYWITVGWEYTAIDGTIVSWNRETDLVSIEREDGTTEHVQMELLVSACLIVGTDAETSACISAKKNGLGWNVEIHTISSTTSFNMPISNADRFDTKAAEIAVQRKIEIAEAGPSHIKVTVRDRV